MTPTASSPTDPTKLGPEEALARFAGPDTSLQERRAALTALITAKLLPKQAEHADVVRGRQILLSKALTANESGDRLLAIAECIRLTQVVKRWASEVVSHLRPAFASELPPMQLLGDADDRLNLARACAQMQAEWLPDYLARSVAEEEAGEKTRAELVAALLARSPTLAKTLQHLATWFEMLRPDTEAPGETIARRLTRTLSTLRDALLDSELDAGDGLGKALHALVAGPLSAIGKPQDEKVRIDLSREALLALHDIVRTRMSVTADPEMYRVVDYCRKLCGGGTWPDELRKPLERLITDVTEALVLLGRQGQCDQDLVDQLQVLCNYPERAQAVARDLAAKHPELPEQVRDWLERGRQRVVRKASEAAVEAAVSNADESIGLALQAARQARQLSEGLRQPLAASIEIYEPTLASAAKELLDRVQVLAVQVEQTASLRSIALYGTPGEEVEMAAKFFNVVGNAPRQRMIVLQPAVVRLRPDGSVGDVVTKGLVE